MKSNSNYRASGAGVTRRRFLKVSTALAGAAVFAAGNQRQVWAKGATSSGSSSKLNVAVIGCGRQGTNDLKNLLSIGVNVIALCDVDENLVHEAREAGGHAVNAAKGYTDYRKLLDTEKSLDAVLIATCDHWHAPLSKAFMQAGKHVYCEKPLTHTLGEARELRTLAKTSKVVTQMGNQGSASQSLRRSVEVIQAGALGQIHEVHCWVHGGTWPAGMTRPAVADPIPAGLNWDFWMGPSPVRPYHKTLYHPYNWHGWFDFGTGQLGNFACHAMNLPMRALHLEHPEKIEIVTKPGSAECFAMANHVRFDFAARKDLDPVSMHWYDGLTPPENITSDVTRLYKKGKSEGVLIVGEKGIIFTNVWNKNGLIKLNGEARLTDVSRHAATKNIPVTLPRVQSHAEEWIDACKGGPKTYSDFQTAGQLTEIVLAGVLALRLGRGIEWDGVNMQVKGAPEADKFIHPTFRKDWLIGNS